MFYIIDHGYSKHVIFIYYYIYGSYNIVIIAQLV
jgi:hypothetical protein